MWHRAISVFIQRASSTSVPEHHGAGAPVTVTYAIVALLGVTVLLFMGLIVLRLVRSRRERVIEDKKRAIRPLVYELITGEHTPEDAARTFRSVIPGRDHPVLEAVLLENARTVKGRERDALAYVFDALGFADEDIRSLREGGRIRKAEAAFHLGTMRTAKAVPHLIAALDSDRPEVEFACMNALSKIGTPEALDAVADYLVAAPGIETLRVAEVILERKQEFTGYLRDWLERSAEDPGRLFLIVGLIGAMRDPGSVPLLLPLLEHPVEKVRARAAFALGAVGDPSACRRLGAAMGDRSPQVRAEVAQALGILQCEGAIPALKKGLLDPSLPVRLNSAVALSRLGEEGHAALERGLGAAEELERQVAAEVLDRERVRGGGDDEGEGGG